MIKSTNWKKKTQYFLKTCKERKIIEPGHFELTSKRHAIEYVNKDTLYARAPFDPLFSELCQQIAYVACDEGHIDIDAVVAPATGGIILEYFVARHFSEITAKSVYGIYAEKKIEKMPHIYIPAYGMQAIYKPFVYDGTFTFREAYRKLIPYKKIFVVDDILTTGASIKGVIDAVRSLGGVVEYAGVLWNRGGIEPEDIGVKEIFSAITKRIKDWDSKDCPACKRGIPLTRLK